MRIGIVTGEFPPMQGGVGAFSLRLAQAAAAQGHEIHVITDREARLESEERGLRRLAQLREPSQMAWGWLHPVARRWGWRDIGEAAQVAIRYDIEIINIQYQAAAYNMRSPAINLAPWRLRRLTPTVVTFHDLRVPYLFPKAGRLRRYVVQLAAQKAHGVIVTNAEDERSIEHWKLDRLRIRRIPIGSNIVPHDVGERAISEARRDLGLDQDTFLLGYFGFLNAGKGADILLQALAKLDENVHLVFMGGRTGSSDAENNRRFVTRIEGLTRQLGLHARVHWTGFLPDRALSTLFQAVDLVVLPYRDGVSLRRGTLMAALAHRRPVVTTEPKYALPELDHGRNVWLVAPDETGTALANAIARLRQDDSLRQTLAAGSGALGETFSWHDIAARTVDFFNTL